MYKKIAWRRTPTEQRLKFNSILCGLSPQVTVQGAVNQSTLLPPPPLKNPKMQIMLSLRVGRLPQAGHKEPLSASRCFQFPEPKPVMGGSGFWELDLFLWTARAVGALWSGPWGPSSAWRRWGFWNIGLMSMLDKLPHLLRLKCIIGSGDFLLFKKLLRKYTLWSFITELTDSLRRTSSAWRRWGSNSNKNVLRTFSNTECENMFDISGSGRLSREIPI